MLINGLPDKGDFAVYVIERLSLNLRDYWLRKSFFTNSFLLLRHPLPERRGRYGGSHQQKVVLQALCVFLVRR